MKYLTLCLLILTACATAKPDRPTYEGALSEIYRRQEVSKRAYRAYDQNKTSYSCTSNPVYAVFGDPLKGESKRYYVIRHDVRCQ